MPTLTPATTILDLHAAFRSKELTSRQLVEECLARIESLEPELKAWVFVDREGALKAADEADTRIAASQPMRALEGIPLGIKDLFDVAGWPTLAGSEARVGHVANADARVVARLRAAGGIFLGKTVTTQFACFDPAATRNPWNVERTPGGSSSGSAAAVASGMCVAAIGSQTGGSIVRPASYCGIVGLKPRWRQRDLEGVVPLSPSLDHPGPITATVDDTAILNAVMTAEELPAVSSEPLVELERFPLSGVVHLKDFFFDAASPEVQRVTLDALARCGLPVEDAPAGLLPCPLAEVHAMHRRIMVYEMTQLHGELFRSRRSTFLPGISTLFEEGMAVTHAAYVEAQEHHQRFRVLLSEKLMGMTLVMPATSVTAPTPETTGDPRWNSPWSYSGLPSVTIPCGLASDRLPCGLQIIGHTYVHALAVARHIAGKLGPLPHHPRSE
jgi:Asp-tRNA(Asn)/Glu-tRNA(Gln) amidotransferase A subunit family amidase